MSSVPRVRLGLVLVALSLAPAVSGQQGGLGLGFRSPLGQPAAEAAAAGAEVEIAREPDPVRPGSWTFVELRFACREDFYVWHDSIKVAAPDPPVGMAVAEIADDDEAIAVN